MSIPETGMGRNGIVMVHGSGPMDRNNDGYFTNIRDRFVKYGIVVLCYDKRGVGGSTGNWQGATMIELASDAVAAVRFLRDKLPGDGREVGVFGHSQGGWIGPLAATMTREVGFVIMNSGPVVPVWSQALYEIENKLAHSNLPPSQILDATIEIVKFFKMWLEGLSFDELQPELEKLKSEPLSSILQFDEEVFQQSPVHGFLDYDPYPILEKLTCPVLAIFGGRDNFVPVQVSMDKFESAMYTAHNPDHLTKLFAEADHRIQVNRRFVNGYFELLSSWLKNHRFIESI
jgi:pimeloyl-ACP methyl ester carboxylesterase